MTRETLLCVMDPQQQGNDLGRSTYNYHEVQRAFRHAFNMLTNTAPSRNSATHLQRLFRVHGDLIAWRKRIENLFPEGGRREVVILSDGGEEGEEGEGEVQGGYVSQWGGYVSDDDAVFDLFESSNSLHR